MFGFLKKGNATENIEIITAPIIGEAVESAQINDPTFAEEMLGKGIAIRPEIGKMFSPVDGTVTTVFETKHAVSFTSEKGAEVLVHVGLDTVNLKGEYYTAHVKDGDTVKKGDLILEFDMGKIREAGYDLITPIVICNTDDYQDIETITGKSVNTGDAVMKLKA
ncbi:MAG: PTS glucose transporter subunit IIA [Lachnospiraceae bacterium]